MGPRVVSDPEPDAAGSLRRLDRTDLDIAERHLSVVALKGQIANVRPGEQGHAPELAPGHARLEIVAAEDILEVRDTVDLVDAFFRCDEQANEREDSMRSSRV